MDFIMRVRKYRFKTYFKHALYIFHLMRRISLFKQANRFWLWRIILRIFRQETIRYILEVNYFIQLWADDIIRSKITNLEAKNTRK